MKEETLIIKLEREILCDEEATMEGGDSGLNLLSLDNDSATLGSYSWVSGTMSNTTPVHQIGRVNANDVMQTHRMYMSFELPTLPRVARIKKALISFKQTGGMSSFTGGRPRIGLYHVTGDIVTGSCAPAYDTKYLDYEMMKTQTSTDLATPYTFDITALVDKVSKGETTSAKLMLRAIDETTTESGYAVVYGSGSGTNAPVLTITYESGYGINTSYRSHSHQIGPRLTGSIDLACGNLCFEAEDFSWSGNRMPVTIKHLYNNALGGNYYTTNDSIKLYTADFSAMKLGPGFKLNIMQSMMPLDFTHEGTEYSGYVYMGENAEEVYFAAGSDTKTNAAGTEYYLYEDLDGNGMVYDPDKRILTQGGETYMFDAAGRLVSITDEHGNCMSITYTDGKITQVTDGAGRSFTFAYNSDNTLYTITAPNGHFVRYTYNANGYLDYIIYPDETKTRFSMNANGPAFACLYEPGNKQIGVARYTYTKGRVTRVLYQPYDGEAYTTVLTNDYEYSAAANRTVVTTTEAMDAEMGESADNVIKTVYTFDDEGNVIGEYAYTQELGNIGAEGSGSGIHPHSGDSGLVYGSMNLNRSHSFEDVDNDDVSGGNTDTFTCTVITNENIAKYSEKCIALNSTDGESPLGRGSTQTVENLPAGQYTCSAYIKVAREYTGTAERGVFLRIKDADNNILSESEHLTTVDNQYVRLLTNFELADTTTVKVLILVKGDGMAYVDGMQLEKNPCATPYNLLVNGNFENGNTGWELNDAEVTTEECFDMTYAAKVTGETTTISNVNQSVPVKTARSTRETFVLSGWAKAQALPKRTRPYIGPAFFRLRAEVNYEDTLYDYSGVETFFAEFSPDTDGWQYASVEFSKSKYRKVKDIKVYCDYAYNYGSAYFDNIQLVRTGIETGLSESDFYEETDIDADEEVDTTDETEDSSAPEFEELLDAFGNALTETTYSDGEFGTMYRSFNYNAATGSLSNAGNDLVSETDSRGNITQYAVDEVTSRNEEVADRLGNKTAYEYDCHGRTTKVTGKKADGTVLGTVAYTYDGVDNMTAITRGDGMKYNLSYAKLGGLTSIGIEGKAENLVTYAYKEANGRLKQVTYANGDYMKASYNSIGQLIAEKWYNSADTLTAHYKYVHDGEGNIVRSIDIINLKEYNYSYEDGRLTRSTECSVTLNSNELVTKKNLVNSILYYYDDEGELTKKRIIPVTGSEQVIYYETPDNENTVVKFTAGGKTITSHSKTDSFGRKVFDELQLGTGFVSRQFDYHLGEVSGEYVEQGMLKSTPTTMLVREISFSNGRTISYEYDEEERITKVTDTYSAQALVPNGYQGDIVTDVTTYSYDALGQLNGEITNGLIVNSMTYDNYGNILTKNGISYTYDTTWKDKLVSYNGQTITYDAQGNPTNYLGNTLTWEKGRQLKQFTKTDGTAVAYTYNANGIRTSKTVNGTTHTYTLDGTKILSETWGSNTLIPLYDNEDEVCGIIYNDTPYYFFKNQQGDVVEIVDANADVVARYTYDAWGKILTVRNVAGINITDTSHIAYINPYRYRSYYYDEDTGLYYLQSRYYDAEVGRFVNGDEPMFAMVSMEGIDSNLYTYCYNSAINMLDANGYIATNVIGAIVGGILGLVGGKFLGKWLADILKIKKKIKRKLFIGAVALLVGASAAAIGSVVAPYISKAWNYIGAKLAGLLKGNFRSIGKISSQTMHHINVGKHLWGKVMSKVNTTQIKTIIYEGIRKGVWEFKTNGSIKILYEYKGRIIVITGKVIDGIFRISDAWVWNGIGKP